MSNAEQLLKAHAVARATLILDDIVDDEDAKLPRDTRQVLEEHVSLFPFSGYNGNDSTESGDISGE